MELLKNNRNFDFIYGGIPFSECEFETKRTEKDNSITTTYTFPDGLVVTNIARKIDKFGAYEWVNYLENTGSKSTKIISELWDCDCKLPIEHEEVPKYQSLFPDVKTATKIYAPTGSTWVTDEFCTDVDKLVFKKRINHIYPGDCKEYTANGGRSSDAQAPFFNIHKNGAGYVFAIGWSGQWKCNVLRGHDDITIKTKVEDTYFRMLPGEKFRTSSVVIMPYTGDFIDGQNKWRRLVKEEFSQIGSERAEYGPLCAQVWGGMKTSSVLDRVEKIKKNNLPYEYVWIDAGWYGYDTQPTPDEFEGDWEERAGDWRISTEVHPNKMKDISDAVHEAGMKFLLWCEPERAVKNVPMAFEHPEYFLDSNDENNMSLMLNLGNNDAWQYCYDTLEKLIGDLNVDCYRQDFNFEPLEYWRKNDAGDRKGISEIKYINGFYRLWDCLLEKFPKLIIDDCASGGRRIDIETLRRSMPLWRSDYQCPANYDSQSTQCHNQSYNTWMPYSGTSAGRLYDEYRIRGAYAAAMATAYTFSEHNKFCEDPEEIRFMQRYLNEYLRVRPYLSEDFYPLTEYSDKFDIWCASQFNRPECSDGMIEIFRRENSPYNTATFKLRGLDAERDYEITDADDDSSVVISGKTLIEKGFDVSVPMQYKAKIYFYNAL